MTTCEHPNEGADLNRWSDLTESLRGKIPGASLKLHKEFERGLEVLLRRQVPVGELSSVINRVPATVTLTIASDGLIDPDLLPALVRRTARQLIPTSAPAIEAEVDIGPNVILAGILQHLPHNQREALEMVYVDGADHRVVCALKGLTIKELTTIKSSVRERFMVTVNQRSKAVHQ
jgi:hypothetical protein